MNKIKALVFNDPSCPWGYSMNPSMRALEWRYRDQIEWHLAVIGLSDPENPVPFGPEKAADLNFEFRRRFGMPFAIEAKLRPVTSGRACRVITASRLLFPGSEWRVLRTLQLLHFNTPLHFDDASQLSQALETVPGLEAAQVMAAVDSPEVSAAYEADWAHARSAAGGAAELQGRTASGDGLIRYTAGSVIYEFGEQRAEVGGYQPVEAHDVIIANFDPSLRRMEPAADPLQALGLYPAGLTTQEVTAVMASEPAESDRDRIEAELTRLLARKLVNRVPLGNDALWVKS